MIQSEWNVLKHIRFSVFPPFIEECDDTTTKSDNDKSDINNPNEIFYVKHEKTEKNANSGQRKSQKVQNPKSSFPKKAKGVPRKSSTQSRSGNDVSKEPKTTPTTKREFRRSISSESSLSSRPSSSGTRETVAEKIIRQPWYSIVSINLHNPYFQGEISEKSWKRTCHFNFQDHKDDQDNKDGSPQKIDSQDSGKGTFKDEEDFDICLACQRWKQGKTTTERKG